MSHTLESLGLDRLSVDERLALLEEIWNSLPPEVEAGETPEWHRVELERRRIAAEVEPGIGRPWREALASLERFA